MYATPEATDILFITEQAHESADARAFLGIEAGIAPLGPDLSNIRSHLDDGTARCLLVASDIGEAETVSLLSGLSDRSVPTIVFAADREDAFVDRVLESGASDVIQSTVADTPSKLLKQRIERITSEQLLTKTRDTALDRYQTLLDTAADAIFQVDATGSVVEANRAAIDLIGYERSEMIGTNIASFVDDETLEEIQQIRTDQRAGEADDVLTVELNICHRDDEAIPCETRIKVLREDDTVAGWVCVARDIRDKQKREAELDRIRELLTNAELLGDVGVWEVNLDAGDVFWSDGVRRIRGVGDDLDPSTDDVLSFYHPDDRERVSDLVVECQETGEQFSTEARIITPDDETRWVHLQGEPIDTANSRNVRGYIQDITEQIEREQQLQSERDLLEQVLDLSPVGIVTINRSGTIVQANEQAASILGHQVADLVGSDYMLDQIRVCNSDGEELARDQYPAYRILEDSEERHTEELIIERPDGGQRFISVDGVPLYDDGEIERVILTFDDVTDSVERESRLTEQRNELAQLDHINRIIRGVDQALLGATSREEIMQAVCERLSESNRYRFALALESIGDQLEPTTWEGPADEFVERTFPVEDPTAESCPAMKAVQADEVVVIQDIANPEEIDQAVWDESALEAGVRSVVALPISYEDQMYGIISIYAPFSNSFSERELAVLEELRETVGYAIAAVERREREEILTALYETTQDLLAADRPEEITDAVVSAASNVLDAPGVGICLFDDDENVLRTTSATDELLAFYGGVTEFGPGKEDSATWQAYATGETAFFRDIRASQHVVNPETEGRSTLLIPLGDHGVFVVSSDQLGVFGEKMRHLIGLLAATTEAALDRVAGRADIRERDRELAEQTERVKQLDELLDLLKGITERVPEAGTRSEIETAVSEQLSTHPAFRFAWTGHIPPDTDVVEPTAWAGTDDGYLDAISLAFDAGEPVPRAAANRELVSVADVTDQLQQADWARHAVDRDIQSVIAVPLIHGETTYGVLAVYATEPDIFEPPVEGVLRQIAQMTAYAIKTIETSQGVLAEQLTEIELAVSNPDTFLNAVATVAGEPVTYRELTPQPDGSTQALFSLTDPPVEEILALESEFVSVDSLSVIEQGCDEQLFRVTLSGQTVAASLLDCGGIPSSVVAAPGETTASVHLSREIDVRVFIDRISQQYPEIELRSRQNIDATATSENEIRAVIDEDLTDRQREVLLTAYESGYFKSPRDTTGEQLAALLDLSQPTVTHHLREAQRRLYEALLDEN